jgi:hypothetical protein
MAYCCVNSYLGSAGMDPAKEKPDANSRIVRTIGSQSRERK